MLVFEGTAANDFDGDVTLTNIDIFNNTGYAIHMSNVSSDSAATITTGNGLTWDGGAGAAGGMRFNNYNGTFTGNSSTLANGTLDGVNIGGSSSGNIDLNDTVTFDSVDGTTINVGPNGGDVFSGDLTVEGNITNHDTGRLVSIQRMNTVGTNVPSVTLSGDMTDVANTNSQGIFVGNNTTGTVLFSGDLRIDTTGFNGIDLENNGTTDISFSQLVDVTTDGANANGFEATGGGILTVSGTTNEISTSGSIGVRIEGMTINAAAANFSRVDVATAEHGIELRDNTGGAITFGTLNDPIGDGGTISDTTEAAIVIDNSANVAVRSMIIDSPGEIGIEVTKDTTGTQTVNLEDLRIGDDVAGTAGSTQAIDVIGDGGTMDTLTMTVADVAIQDATDRGIRVNNVDSGLIAVTNTSIDGDDVTATAQGVEIIGSNATITFDTNTTIQQFDGTDFHVNGGTPAVTFNGDITNTTGQSVEVQNISGGSVTFSSSSMIDDDGAGIRVNGNSANGTIAFNGILDLDTTTNDAVVLLNNTGATINFAPPVANPIDIDTTTGRGFVATGGGTLNVAGTNNTITTTTGRGLNIEGMTINAVDFQSVNVNGADHGIRLVNNTSGTITVGDTGTAVGGGGTIQNTTDAGVHVENSNVTLNGVTVNNAGNTNGENAVEILHTDATAMNANLNRLTVNNATALRDGVVIDGNTGSGTFNANIQNLDVDVTGDGLVVDNGVTLTAGGTNTIDTVTGVGLTVSDSTIAAAGANFQRVTVTNGTTSGILLSNLTGGQIAVTGTGTTTNSGGSLTTTGNAIVLANVENVDLSNIRVVNSAVGIEIDHTTASTSTMDVTIDNLNLSAAATDGINVSADSDAFDFALRLTDSDINNAGVLVDVTGAATFEMLVDNTEISTDLAGRAFDLQVHGDATDVDVTIRNSSDFVATDGEGLFIDSFDATAKDVKINIQDSSFTDTNGTEIAADIRNRGTSLMQLTIQGNNFTSASAARDLSVASSGYARLANSPELGRRIDCSRRL